MAHKLEYCPGCLRKLQKDKLMHFCSYCGLALTRFGFDKVKYRQRRLEREGYDSLCYMSSKPENLEKMIYWRNKTLYG